MSRDPERERERLRWIPVTERLPGRNEIVIVRDGVRVSVGSYSPMMEDWWSLSGSILRCSTTVTHWMPLPEPPEVEQGEEVTDG